MKHIYLFVFLFISSLSFAQGVKVTEVKEVASGSEAFNAPVDSNGNSCGLVKVHSMMQDLTFDGNVIGDVAFVNNEYKVFLGKESQQLIIKRPHVLPVVVIFLDYGIYSIASKATYAITLKEESLNTKKNQLHFDVKPAFSKFYLNNLLIDNESGDGSYNLILPKGDYICKVEALGYRTQAFTFKIGKEPQVFHVELESLLAELEVNSQTSGADIFINGEKKAAGSWKGKIPAGTYTIAVQLDGFVPVEKVVQLAEKDSRTISIPALKRAKGEVVITTSLRDAMIYIDGEQMGTNKCSANLQTGAHQLMVRSPFGYKEINMQFEVRTGRLDTIHVEMKPLNEAYAKAFTGDVKAQVEICHQKIESSKYSPNDTIERNYWYERIYENLDKLNGADLERINYEEGMDICGFYAYYKNNSPKGLKILYQFVKYNLILCQCVYNEIVQHNIKLQRYEDVIKWGTNGITHREYDDDSFKEDIIEACIKINNVNKGVKIILDAVNENWNPNDKYAIYGIIGDIYQKTGNYGNSVLYYKKCLHLLNVSHLGYSDWVIEELKKKIRQCGGTP